MADKLTITLLGIEPIVIERNLLARFIEITKIDRVNGWHWSDIDFNNVFHALGIQHQQFHKTLTTDDEYRWFWACTFLPERNQSIVIMLPWVRYREKESQADRDPCVFVFGDIRPFIVHRIIEQFIVALENYKRDILASREKHDKDLVTT
jgi:hypothetical protein